MTNNARTAAAAVLLAAAAVLLVPVTSAQAAGISPWTKPVTGPQHVPACHHVRCPVTRTPSPGPFVVHPARPSIPTPPVR